MSYPSGNLPEGKFSTANFPQRDSLWTGLLAISLVFAYVLPKVLVHYDYPLLSLFEGLWNRFVYVMPSRLVCALKPSFVSSGVGEGQAESHASKSEVLRNVLGFNKLATFNAPPAPIKAPPGLGNWDNSCYQNSVIQSLASLKCFEVYLDRLRLISSEALPQETTLTALQDFLKTLNDRHNASQHLWTPAKLKSMSSWQQQDAQEYFSKIVDQLEKDISEVAKVKGKDTSAKVVDLRFLSTLVEEPTISDQPTNGQGLERQSAGQDSCLFDLHNPIEGHLAQRVGCTQCGHTDGLSLIPFNCLTLPLGRNSAYDIRDCLDEYTSMDFIDGVECAKCTLIRSQQSLHQLSEALSNQAKHEPEATSSPDTRTEVVLARLRAVEEALIDESFSESTLSKKCQIPGRLRVNTTKSRQAVLMRAPKCLVMHINRSLYDEVTGSLLKNHANVEFPLTFDLAPWCVGSGVQIDQNIDSSPVEAWVMNPCRSMLEAREVLTQTSDCLYNLKSVITHYGRHENGHYICYRNLPSWELDGQCPDDEKANSKNHQWWRLSDDEVSQVSEKDVLKQGGVFMLFYEQVMISNQSAVLPREPSNDVTSPEVAAETTFINPALIESSGIVTVTESTTEEPVGKSPALVEPGPILPLNPRLVVRTAGTTDTNSESSDVQSGHLSTKTLVSEPFLKKTINPPAMRTAGLPHERSSDLPPLTSLRMVASS